MTQLAQQRTLRLLAMFHQFRGRAIDRAGVAEVVPHHFSRLAAHLLLRLKREDVVIAPGAVMQTAFSFQPCRMLVVAAAPPDR